jgi:type III pantothenate kinase
VYLTLDIGNTRIKYQYWNLDGNPLTNGEVTEFWQIENLLLDVEAMSFCNVRGVSLPNFKNYIGSVLEVNGKIKLPFQSAYKTPETLGSDRIAAVAGACRLYSQKNVLCIDAGTCIKFDLIDSEGIYHGGSISPGLAMRYKALNHYTGRLPEVMHRSFDDICGLSTEESILCGVQQGFLGETEFRIAAFKEKYSDLTVIITGGDAQFLANRLKTMIFAEPMLVHHGLLHCLLNQ